MEQRNFKLWSRSGGLSPGPQGPNHPDSSLRSGQCSGTGSASPALTFSKGETEAWKLNGLALESKISLLEPNTTHVHKIPDFRQPCPQSRRNSQHSFCSFSTRTPVQSWENYCAWCTKALGSCLQHHLPSSSSPGLYMLQCDFCCSWKIRSWSCNTKPCWLLT